MIHKIYNQTKMPALKSFEDITDPKTGQPIIAANKEAARAKRQKILAKMVDPKAGCGI